MTVREEILSIQRELKLTDVDVCNCMCISLEEYNAFVQGKYKPSIFNLILWISSVGLPLESLLPPPTHVWVPVEKLRKYQGLK